jgi:hypothetical protein
VKKSENEVAHMLVRWAAMEPNKIRLENLPPHIIGHIQRYAAILIFFLLNVFCFEKKNKKT